MVEGINLLSIRKRLLDEMPERRNLSTPLCHSRRARSPDRESSDKINKKKEIV